VEVEKRVQVDVPYEIEVPVYIDRPSIDDEWIRRYHDLEDELGAMMNENQLLKSENHGLKMSLGKLQTNLDLLNHHNHEKNREVEQLLSNRGDYLPPKMKMEAKERNYSVLDRTTSTLSPRSHHHLRYL
jgi:regulator of replication initiation timing